MTNEQLEKLREKKRKYYERHKEEINASIREKRANRTKEEREEEKEKRQKRYANKKEQAHAYYERNKERLLERQHERYRENRECELQKKKSWYNLNRAASHGTRQLCEYCAKFAGGCSWTDRGDDGRVKFEPVPGWNAIPTVLPGRTHRINSFKIIECPEYEDDGSRAREEELRKKSSNKLEVMTTYKGEDLFFSSVADAARWAMENGQSEAKSHELCVNAMYSSMKRMDEDGCFRYRGREFFLV